MIAPPVYHSSEWCDDMANYILKMKNITKLFPGVKALDNVNLNVERGEIHALVGENGAGKSTLMNVIGGIHPYGSYTGRMIFEGRELQLRSIRESEKLGISFIHQELSLVPYLTIAENIFLGNECARGGIIDWQKSFRRGKELMDMVGLNDKPTTLVGDIGVGKQQLVEIAKALTRDVKLLILDEPTAALNDNDSDHLLNLLTELNQSRGITCIIISHKIHEVIKIANKITVIRDGATIETLVKGLDEITEDRIIKGMVGREMKSRFPKRTPNIGDVGFEVKDWVVYDPLDEDRIKINNVSFHIKKGEVVGFAGLMGAGRTELAMSLFGRAYGKKISGRIIKDGKDVDAKTVGRAISEGIAYLTEDRKGGGLVLIDDIKRNISLASLKNLGKYGVINQNEEVSVAEKYRNLLGIRSSSIFQKAGDLSGGNQQKVVISKWIFSQPDVLMLDEPTRGIDVGAKYEIYKIINDLAAGNKCVLFISSELPELLGMCDRIYVVNEGRIVGEVAGKEATQESIMRIIIQSSNKQKTEAI